MPPLRRRPSETGAPLIRIERVRKEFGRDIVAVSDMSLTIERGDFISFLGPSGCGKSTALRMIAGLLPITAGQIDIAPSQVDTEHDLGFVFQEPTLMPWATVFENVWLPLRLAGLSRAPPQATGFALPSWKSACRGSRTPIRANCRAA